MNQQEVLVVGSANQDIVVRVDRLPKLGETILGEDVVYLPGGKGLNQACACGATGTRTHFLGAVGADGSGAQLLAAMRERGVDVDLTPSLDEVATGTAHILVSANGGNQIVVVPAANSQVSEVQVQHAFAALPDPRVLVLQGEIPFATSLAAAELMGARGGRTVFNLAPAAEVPERLLALADPLVVNEFEAGLILGVTPPSSRAEAAERARELLARSRSVIITLGAQGSVVADQEGTEEIAPTEVAEVVDTTGAGDAFVGVLAAELCHGQELREAARRASLAAAQSVTRPGASQSYGAIEALYREA
ncbi:ribokinase [Actinomyces sp. F1_1611]